MISWTYDVCLCLVHQDQLPRCISITDSIQKLPRMLIYPLTRNHVSIITSIHRRSSCVIVNFHVMTTFAPHDRRHDVVILDGVILIF